MSLTAWLRNSASLHAACSASLVSAAASRLPGRRGASPRTSSSKSSIGQSNRRENRWKSRWNWSKMVRALSPFFHFLVRLFQAGRIQVRSLVQEVIEGITVRLHVSVLRHIRLLLGGRHASPASPRRLCDAHPVGLPQDALVDLPHAVPRQRSVSHHDHPGALEATQPLTPAVLRHYLQPCNTRHRRYVRSLAQVDERSTWMLSCSTSPPGRRRSKYRPLTAEAHQAPRLPPPSAPPAPQPPSRPAAHPARRTPQPPPLPCTSASTSTHETPTHACQIASCSVLAESQSRCGAKHQHSAPHITHCSTSPAPHAHIRIPLPSPVTSSAAAPPPPPPRARSPPPTAPRPSASPPATGAPRGSSPQRPRSAATPRA